MSSLTPDSSPRTRQRGRFHDADGRLFLTCKECQVVKEATPANFVLNARCKAGVSAWCRECRIRYMKAYRDKPAQQERRRAYHRATYVPADRAKKERERVVLAPEKARAKIMRNGLRERAKLGHFVDPRFTVEFLREWLCSRPNCECCGVTFRVGVLVGDGTKCNASPSLDRFEPSLGYAVGNVRLICWRCNNLKRDATADELERIVTWMRRVSAGMAEPA